MPSRPKPTTARATPVEASPLWHQRLRRWWRGLQERPLRLECRGWQFHLVLAEPRAGGDSSANGDALGGEALRRGHRELRALLDHHPKTRRTLRHLAYLERSLAHHGSRALSREVPVPVLKKCAQQIELLAHDERSEGLDALRAQMQAAIVRRRGHEGSGFAPLQTVDVSEASASVFDELERSWTGRVPLSGPSDAPIKRP